MPIMPVGVCGSVINGCMRYVRSESNSDSEELYIELSDFVGVTVLLVLIFHNSEV